MYVSTTLKHIFFAIELGLSAKLNGLHIVENSGYFFSKRRLCANTRIDKQIHLLYTHTHTNLRLISQTFPKIPIPTKPNEPKLISTFPWLHPPIICVIPSHQGRGFH